MTVFAREAEGGWDGGAGDGAPRIVLGIGQQCVSIVEGRLHTAHAVVVYSFVDSVFLFS